MKIIRPLKITSDEFFDYIEAGLQRDLMMALGDDYAEQPLEAGLTYTKNADNKYTRTEVEVLQYERGRIYQARSVSLSDDVTVTYEVETTPKGIQVTYTQDMKSFNEKAKKQLGVVRGFSEAVHLGRMGESLVTLQYKIIDERNGVAPKPQQNVQQHRLLKKLVEKSAEKKYGKSE